MSETPQPHWVRVYLDKMDQARALLAQAEISVRPDGHSGTQIATSAPAGIEPARLARQCAGCGKLFDAGQKYQRKYCTGACGNRTAARRIIAGELCPLCTHPSGQHLGACRLGLAVRDEWHCWICTQEVSLEGTGALTPAFIHLRPRNQGGLGSAQNLSLVHAGCAVERHNAGDVVRKEAKLPPPEKGRPPRWIRRYLAHLDDLAYLSIDPDGPLLDIEAARARPVDECMTCGTKTYSASAFKERYCSRRCFARLKMFARLRAGVCIVCDRNNFSHAQNCRLMLAQRDNWTCWLCGEPILLTAAGRSAATLDHVVPKLYKGPNTAANLRLAHARCNNRRGAPEPHSELLAQCAPELLTT